MKYLLLSFAFLGSLALTRLIIAVAPRLGMLDTPNQRSSHRIATPRGGGLSFVLAFLIGLSITYVIGEITKEMYLSLVVGGLMVGMIGMWDDYSHIKAGVRLFVHLLAAIAALIWIGGLQFIQIYDYSFYLGSFGYLLSLFLILWLINLFNFMDGIDGLAGIEAIFVSISAAMIILMGYDNQNEVSQLSESYGNTIDVLLLLLAFSVLGFLMFNWPPAKIFMGDVGSGFLGFVFGVLVVSTAITGKLTIWAWLILLGIFIVDATFTLVRRILDGQRWYEAHRTHAYQQATQRWDSHRLTTLTVLIVNITWLLPLAWIANKNTSWGALLMICAYSPLIALALYLKAGKVK